MNFFLFVPALFAVVAADINPFGMPPKSCATVYCFRPPNICPNGEAPMRPGMECCPVCLTEPIDCKRRKCAKAPTVCGNGVPVRMPGECCAECLGENCSQNICGDPPTKYCRAGQMPRPPGYCCPSCKLNCEGIVCRPCPAGYKSEISPNSCCSVCR